MRTRTIIADGGGEGQLQWLKLESLDTGETFTQQAEGLFCLLGAEPDIAWLSEDAARDERGFVLTGRDVPRESWVRGSLPASLETTVPDLFAIGGVAVPDL